MLFLIFPDVFSVDGALSKIMLRNIGTVLASNHGVSAVVTLVSF